MRIGPVFPTLLAIIVALSPAIADSAKTAKMYKPEQCGCCDEYARYLEEHGFKLTVESLPERQFDLVKRSAEVPERLTGCHTLLIDGYVVEGLVPVGILNKLLREKPKIKGISLPGMPVGAPGMPGRKNGPLVVYELGTATPKVFATD